MTKFIKFSITNTYKAFKVLLLDIVKFLRRLVDPLTFPWAAAHMTLLYYELTVFYLSRCKAKHVPFIEPTTGDLAYATSHIKDAYFYDDIKEKTTYGLGTKIKFLLAPYSAAEPYKQKLKELKDIVANHNKQFQDESVEDMEDKMIASLDVYNSIFGLNGF